MSSFSQLGSFSLPLNTVVSLALLIILGAYTIFSAVLYYHWKEYSSDSKMTGLTLILYFGTTIPLLIVMGIMTYII